MQSGRVSFCLRRRDAAGGGDQTRGIFRKLLNEEKLKEERSITDSVKGPFRTQNQLSELYFESALLRLTILALRKLDFERVQSLQNVPRERVEKAMVWYNDHLQRFTIFVGCGGQRAYLGDTTAPPFL